MGISLKVAYTSPGIPTKVRHLVEQALLCSPPALAFKQLDAKNSQWTSQRRMGLTQKDGPKDSKVPKENRWINFWIHIHTYSNSDANLENPKFNLHLHPILHQKLQKPVNVVFTKNPGTAPPCRSTGSPSCTARITGCDAVEGFSWSLTLSGCHAPRLRSPLP